MSSATLPALLRYPLAVLSLTLPLVALAQPPDGRLLASQCGQCHGTDGHAVSGFTSLAGRNASDLYHDLLEMQTRPVEGIMDRQARGYTPEQLWAIAQYFASLPATR